MVYHNNCSQVQWSHILSEPKVFVSKMIKSLPATICTQCVCDLVMHLEDQIGRCAQPATTVLIKQLLELQSQNNSKILCYMVASLNLEACYSVLTRPRKTRNWGLWRSVIRSHKLYL
jgi:hypothetical protein